MDSGQNTPSSIGNTALTSISAIHHVYADLILGAGLDASGQVSTREKKKKKKKRRKKKKKKKKKRSNIGIPAAI